MAKIINLDKAPRTPAGHSDPQWEKKICAWALDQLKQSNLPSASVRWDTGHGKVEVTIDHNTTPDKLLHILKSSRDSLIKSAGRDFFLKINEKDIEWKRGELIFRLENRGKDFSKFLNNVMFYGDALAKNVPNVLPLPIESDYENKTLTIKGETAKCYAFMLRDNLKIDFIGNAVLPPVRERK